MDLDYSGFNEFEFVPKQEGHAGEVYILVFKVGDAEAPFYIGQTKRFLGRMDDYFWADFQATTDFRVGMAIQYFCGLPNGKVVVRHKLVADPAAEEKAMISRFVAAKKPLLNGIGYDYKTATVETVLDQVHAKCREIAGSVQAE